MAGIYALTNPDLLNDINPMNQSCLRRQPDYMHDRARLYTVLSECEIVVHAVYCNVSAYARAYVHCTHCIVCYL